MNSIPDFICVDGVRWYNGTADALRLGYTNTSKAISDHVRQINKKLFGELCENTTGFDLPILNTIFINEDGRNELIMFSPKAQAIYTAIPGNIS